MATTPVCIITETGMKCLASPIKNHFPSGRECEVAATDPKFDKKMALISKSLERHVPRNQRTIVAKVVRLMLAAKVGGNTAFTIVSPGRCPR